MGDIGYCGFNRDCSVDGTEAVKKPKKPLPQIGESFFGYADLENNSDKRYIIINTSLGGNKLTAYGDGLDDLYKVEVRVVKLSRRRNKEKK